MKVGVYGLGRFGSFWAGVLSKRFSVCGYSRSAHRDTPYGVERVEEAELYGCDAIFLTVAISAMEEVVGRIASKITPGTVVFDTCSVKVHPVETMKRLLPAEVDIIGTHPMFGPDSGRSGVHGLPIVFCPVRVSDERAGFWRTEFKTLGMSVKELTPDEHDREAAYTQGVTHFVGRVLDDLGLKPSSISTVGYTKLLEIIEQTCNDPWQLFLDLQRYNPYTADMRIALYNSLQKIKDRLESSLDEQSADGR